ncbi:Tripeptide permease tppB, putative [Perkinsus marinus ATCC 50983]|uniref:Tripeptide permease tppB, putative n=1 Tax=Perkinsus marinus (strain ATCC 50983 / TXsc) TaxID=423536 RepID=C5LAJ3_PERM5|nr:Tripeptide permease tppB, putative [Perkinsus marinus ATCC 50983]EER06449.1 Tripeptide permease tppB, putative [Perkinsus marinus ATCC 50983]|eukprot:XP_002774633.1 Tripeptide permease tppB, putative [Perkinsus marinus ATCC 50983]
MADSSELKSYSGVEEVVKQDVSPVNHKKPLTWTDASGNVYHYFEHPMMQATIFVLIQELCERLAFYGITPNLQTFLKEFLGYNDTAANTYISAFQAVIYVTPLVAAVLADTLLGVYNTILAFSVVYTIGLGLLCLASIESISEPWMIHLSLMVLITFGSGGIKSCVNVMGAQQFHPELHRAQITRFFTYFYASINVGGLIGGLVTPILVEKVSFFVAYLVPFFAFIIATTIFLIGGVMGRFVKPKPQGSAVIRVIEVIGDSAIHCSLEKCKKSRGGRFEDQFIEDAKAIFRLIPLFALVIPFMIAYAQMTTAFLTQAEKMNRDTFGWQIPAAMMQNVDSISIIVNSLWIDGVLYKYLRQHNHMPSALLRMCIGSMLGCIALLCALGVEYSVMDRPLYSVSVWWQVPQFFLIATGEIFLISTSYEVAFTYSPGQLKAVSSALNLLFFSFSNLLAGVVFQLCAPWMPNFDPDDYPESVMYRSSHYDYYFMLLAGVCVFGAILCLICVPYFNKVEREHAARTTKS